MSSRYIKQLVFGVFYLAVFLAIGFGIFYFFRSQPTCFDKIQNQGEEGIDCGIVCDNSCRKILPVQVSSVEIFKIGEDDFDILAKLYNPNLEYGSSQVDYDLVLLDEGDKELDKRSASFYILPGQRKYLFLNSVKSNFDLRFAKIIVKNAKWEKLQLFDPQSVKFPINSGQFKTDSFDAVIFNDSNFDFDTVDIGVILYDVNDNVLGINLTNVNTLLARTERYFKVIWPRSINNVSRVEVQAQTNLLENSNFIKEHGTQEKFQEYY